MQPINLQHDLNVLNNQRFCSAHVLLDIIEPEEFRL